MIINDKIIFKTIGKNTWFSDKIVSANNNSLMRMLNSLKTDYGFKELNTIADVRIGVVTGANDFFIREHNELKKCGFNDDELLPIITKAFEFPDYIKEGTSNLKKLIQIGEDKSNRFQRFLKEGVKRKYNLRSHCTKRKFWYSIDVAKTPDAFFPYRVGRVPYIIFNEHNNQCTNSIHRIYFKKKLKKTELKWIQISILSIYGQLTLEVNSKTYGKRMLKIEPTALGKSIVLVKSNVSITKTYNYIQKLLIDNKRDEAVNSATEFINKELNIPADFSKKCNNMLLKIRSSRRG